jgi:hypothetical protein
MLTSAAGGLPASLGAADAIGCTWRRPRGPAAAARRSPRAAAAPRRALAARCWARSACPRPRRDRAAAALCARRHADPALLKMMLKGKCFDARGQPSGRDNIRAAWVDRGASGQQVRAPVREGGGRPGPGVPRARRPAALCALRTASRTWPAPRGPGREFPPPLPGRVAGRAQLQGVEGMWDPTQMGLDADDRDRDVPLSGTASPNPLAMHVSGREGGPPWHAAQPRCGCPGLRLGGCASGMVRRAEPRRCLWRPCTSPHSAPRPAPPAPARPWAARPSSRP